MKGLDLPQEMIEVFNERVVLLSKDPQVKKVLNTEFETFEEAKEWLHHQALITLLYTPEERKEMAKNKENM